MPTNTGQQVPLSTIVSIETATDPNALTHYNQLNSATFQAVPMPGVTVGQAVDFLEGEAKKLPAGFSHDYLADFRQYVQEGNQLAVTFGFALIIIFLVLAAQFESLRDPLVIMISVPMAIIGALIPLFFGVATMNIYTQVGLLTLVGLISKHGILMVEFANELQLQEGLDRRSAIEMAARVRLRPILMTTAAMVTGLLPLLTATGAGAASRFSIGLVVVAGMSIGTLFTLFVLPAVYVAIATDHRAAAEFRAGQGDRGIRSGVEGPEADLSLIPAATAVAVAAVFFGLLSISSVDWVGWGPPNPPAVRQETSVRLLANFGGMSISLHPDTSGRTLAAPPAAGAAPGAGSSATRIRSRLFTKYVALFVAVVGVALLSNGIFEVFFYYREHKAALIRIQHEQAEAAAAKIGQFIKEIESQLGWTTQLPWSAGSIEQRRFDALRLLRQVPAITELAQVDSTGKERLRVSRLAMDVVDSGLDLSKDPKFTEAVAHKVYYGPVYFRRESEPYMTLSLAGTRKDAGVSIAEVNLKLIWDVVSQIKVGEHGHAYVVGRAGAPDRASRHQPGAAQHRHVQAVAGAGGAGREQRRRPRIAAGHARTSRARRC